jgi:hypothetical protein
MGKPLKKIQNTRIISTPSQKEGGQAGMRRGANGVIRPRILLEAAIMPNGMPNYRDIMAIMASCGVSSGGWTPHA